MELEALEAIFADHLEEFEGNTPEGWSKHGKTWAITILPSAGVCPPTATFSSGLQCRTHNMCSSRQQQAAQHEDAWQCMFLQL